MKSKLKIFTLFFLFSMPALSNQECAEYEGFVTTYKIAGAVYGSVGALKSNACNDSNFAEKKENLFNNEILNPLVNDDLNKGKYPQMCVSALKDMILEFHDEIKKMMDMDETKPLSQGLCQDAKSMLKSIFED